MGRRILITGASGFIGACLARRLAAKGQDVHLFLRDPSKAWRLRDAIGSFTVHETDITDREAVAKAVGGIKPDIVYHLAAYGAYPHQKDPKQTVETNVLGAVNLVDACASAGFSRFVNVSSSSEYGIKDAPMRETDALEPNSLYGATKAAATQYCRHMAREKSLPIVTFRIFAAYGYYEDPLRLMPSIIVPALKGQRPKLSSPSSVRDFIFIEDILDAFEKAAQTPRVDGEILNLGTGIQHTIKDAAEAVLGLAGCDKEVEWGAVQVKRPEPKAWVADMEKTQRILGWKPGYGLNEGLGKDVDWFRENLTYYE